jgi:hypothetical protein
VRKKQAQLVGVNGGATVFDEDDTESPNVPPGDYELVLDLRAHGVHRHTVRVRECEVTEVRIRPP